MSNKIMCGCVAPETELMLYIWVKGKDEPLFVTREHPIWVQETAGTTKWKSAKDCKTSDKVLVIKDEERYCEIIHIEESEPCHIVYNLDLMPLAGKLGKQEQCIVTEF